MKNAVRYEIDPAQDELRRPGFNTILTELRADKDLMQKLEQFVLEDDGTAAQVENYLRHNAKVIWHERNPGAPK